MTDIYKMNMNLISDSNMYSQFQSQVESRFHTSISLSVAVDIERDQDGISVTTDIYKMDGKYNLISG